MDDKKSIFSPAFIAKYGLPILVGIFFVISLLTTPQVTKEQAAAESSSSAAAVVETVVESSGAGQETAVSEPVTVNPTTQASAATGQAAVDGGDKTDTGSGEAQAGYSAVNGETIIAPDSDQQSALKKAEETVTEDGEYSSMAEVAAYIHMFGRLPSNFISKTKAKEQGWIQSEGNLQEVLPGKSIGGSRFYNDEGILPEKDNRTYTECDIDYKGGKRGAKRIVFSNDGLVFYTEDHYETYIQLY